MNSRKTAIIILATLSVSRALADDLKTVNGTECKNGTVSRVEPSGVCTEDTWTPTSTTGAPANRWYHTAVWSGSEMIVWGGYDGFTYFTSGGRYNPSSDSWTPTSTTNAPAGRAIYTAVWTGTEMIIWGGFDGVDALNTGGRYNPSTDSWTATSTINAPSPDTFTRQYGPAAR